MTSKKPAASQSRAHSDLKSMYRDIGISAVAAALHFQGEPRNHADAPPTVPSSPARALADERFHEAA